MLADIAGHGASVAELGGRLRHAMQRYMNHIDPQGLAARMNHDMNELTPDSGTFATAVILTFFAPDGGLSLCNAGHPPPMLYRARQGRWQVVEQPDASERIENLPLGILEDVGYQGRDMTLQVDDVLFAYTDCLNEATSADGEELGTAGLLKVLNEVASPRGEGREGAGVPGVAMLTQTLLAHLEAQGYALDDDLTTVALRCTGRSEGVGLRAKLAATARTLRHVATGDRPFPWPEFSWLNLGGALLPGVKRARE